jgi:hypothetical protein
MITSKQKRIIGTLSFCLLVTIFLGTIVYSIVLIKRWKPTYVESEVNGVVRIFMHEPIKYTFFCQNSGATKIEQWTVWLGEKPQIFTDVPQGHASRVNFMVHKDYPGGPDIYDYFHIHIHSVREIEGGYWNHGKFGRGQTVVIE